MRLTRYDCCRFYYNTEADKTKVTEKVQRRNICKIKVSPNIRGCSCSLCIRARSWAHKSCIEAIGLLVHLSHDADTLQRFTEQYPETLKRSITQDTTRSWSGPRERVHPLVREFSSMCLPVAEGFVLQPRTAPLFRVCLCLKMRDLLPMGNMNHEGQTLVADTVHPGLVWWQVFSPRVFHGGLDVFHATGVSTSLRRLYTNGQTNGRATLPRRGRRGGDCARQARGEQRGGEGFPGNGIAPGHTGDHRRRRQLCPDLHRLSVCRVAATHQRHTGVLGRRSQATGAGRTGSRRSNHGTLSLRSSTLCATLRSPTLSCSSSPGDLALFQGGLRRRRVAALLRQRPRSWVVSVRGPGWAGNEHVPTPAEDLLAAVPGLTPEQIFSPNVDLTVVQALRGLGMPHAGHECACLFLHRRRITIRNMGGFRACMLDVWGGVDNGARRPLQWLAEQRVLHADGVHGCGVLFCASDRNDRLKAGSMMQAHQRNRTTLYRAVFERNGYVATDCFPYDVPVCYGKTMQTYAFSVYRGRTLKRPRSEA